MRTLVSVWRRSAEENPVATGRVPFSRLTHRFSSGWALPKHRSKVQNPLRWQSSTSVFVFVCVCFLHAGGRHGVAIHRSQCGARFLLSHVALAWPPPLQANRLACICSRVANPEWDVIWTSCGQQGWNTDNNTDYQQQLWVRVAALTINKERCVCVEGGGWSFLSFLSAAPPITIHYHKLGFNKIAIQR